MVTRGNWYAVEIVKRYLELFKISCKIREAVTFRHRVKKWERIKSRHFRLVQTMTFKKINEDTICCILSENDMMDYGVELEDFLMNKEKVQGVLHNIVERAVEELGLQMQKGLLSLQIVPLPDKSLSIMFSEKGQTSVIDFINQMKKLIENLKNDANAIKEQQEKKDSDTKKKKAVKSGESDRGLRIFEFHSLDEAAGFCSYIPTKCKVTSQLYRDPHTNTYLLTFTKSKLSKKDFAAVCARAVEFGTYISDDPARAAYLEEHMEHIVEEKAVKALRKFAGAGSKKAGNEIL